jgi:hypothetical protein
VRRSFVGAPLARRGHVERCDGCGHLRAWYNSCRDRNCPKCQALARAQWLDDRRSELLDTEYFHVVFTVPEPIAAIALQNREKVYNILFRTVRDTLCTIAADPKHLGTQIGFFAVLHTRAFRRSGRRFAARKARWLMVESAF